MKPPSVTKDFIEYVGLSEKEQAIYFAALELGESLQAPLAQKAEIKRTTLRELLPDLLGRGVLEQVVKGRRHFIVAKDPRVLLDELKLKADKAMADLPVLLALQNSLTSKPVVRFYEGIEGIKLVYKETLRAGQPIYSFIEVEAIHPEIQRWLADEYTRERTKRQIRALNIVNASEKLTVVMPQNEFRENRIVSAKSFPFRMEVLTFGDYVAFIQFRRTDTPTAVLIQSQAAAVTMRSIHQLVWR